MKFRIFFIFFLVIFGTSLHLFVSGDDASSSSSRVGVDTGNAGKSTDSSVLEREASKISVDGFSSAEQKIIAESSEKFAFNAEVNKLMQIIVHSLYTNNEVFLRELISNASDALDKIRFLSLTNPAALGTGDAAKMEITIKGDKDSKTVTISDTGVGMTKEELKKNLGTIAQSGTKAFLERYREYSDSNLIGQFGVGFYSVFLVAESVTVVSKHNDDDQHIWQSTADGSFTVSKDPRGNTIPRGSQIIVHLKEDCLQFSSHETLRGLVTRYSQFINFPIKLWTTRQESTEVDLSEEEIAEERQKLYEKAKKERAAEEELEVVSLDGEDGATKSTEDPIKINEDEVPKTRTEKQTVWDWEVMNEVKPLWMRPKEKVKDEEYVEFYKSAMKEYTDPLDWMHFVAEGEIEFKALLYIPEKAPLNMFDGSKLADNIKLYVRRVFITDSFKNLLPKYLSFLRGIVDSDDLPLNVSREQLQQSKLLKLIEKKLVRKAIAMFQEMKEKAIAADASDKDKEKFTKFWEQYGTAIKLGVIEDSANRLRLTKLLQFQSSVTGELTFLEDYVKRMKEGQDSIYYLGGENKLAVETSPLLERLKKRGYEVLYMTDAIDEYTMQNLMKFDGKYTMINVGREGLKLPGDKDRGDKEKELKRRFEALASFFTKHLADEVEKVVVSNRLTTSPSAIVSTSYGYTANMERIMKAQALGDQGTTKHGLFGRKKTMEINPKHPIIIELLHRVEADFDDPSAVNMASVLFETAKLTSGYNVDSPNDFAAQINGLIQSVLGVSHKKVLDDEDELTETKEEAAEEPTLKVDQGGQGESGEEEEEDVKEPPKKKQAATKAKAKSRDHEDDL